MVNRVKSRKNKKNGGAPLGNKVKSRKSRKSRKSIKSRRSRKSIKSRKSRKSRKRKGAGDFFDTNDVMGHSIAQNNFLSSGGDGQPIQTTQEDYEKKKEDDIIIEARRLALQSMLDRRASLTSEHRLNNGVGLGAHSSDESDSDSEGDESVGAGQNAERAAERNDASRRSRGPENLVQDAARRQRGRDWMRGESEMFRRQEGLYGGPGGGRKSRKSRRSRKSIKSRKNSGLFRPTDYTTTKGGGGVYRGIPSPGMPFPPSNEEEETYQPGWRKESINLRRAFLGEEHYERTHYERTRGHAAAEEKLAEEKLAGEQQHQTAALSARPPLLYGVYPKLSGD